MGFNIAQLFMAQAERVPDRPALITPRGEVVTYRALKEDSLRIAGGLQKMGVQVADRLLCMIPMTPDLYRCLIGTLSLGASLVFIDPWIKREQMAQFARYADLKGFIGIPKAHLLRLLDSDLKRLPISISTGSCIFGLPAQRSLRSLKKFSDPLTSLIELPAGSQALITFTSGSSGEPKGANRTHDFLRAQHEALKANFPYNDQDIDITNFPVFALNNLAQGLTTVIPDIPFKQVHQAKLSRLKLQIQQHQIKTCTFSPPLLDLLCSGDVSWLNTHNIKGAPRLRRILVGGAPISDQQLEHWSNTLPDTEIQVVYGSTEAEPVAHSLASDRLQQKPEKCGAIFIGKPVTQISAQVIPIQHGPVTSGSLRPLSPGEIGELIVSGDHVCQSYFRNEKAVLENKIIYPEGTIAHRMGDTGYFDEAGHFYLTGRLHQVIRRSEGGLIHSLLLEEECRIQLNLSHRIAAIAIGDWETGQKICIVIEDPAHELDQAQVITRLKKAGIIFDDLRLHQRAFPLDPRHRSKTDIHSLKKELNL